MRLGVVQPAPRCKRAGGHLGGRHDAGVLRSCGKAAVAQLTSVSRRSPKEKFTRETLSHEAEMMPPYSYAARNQCFLKRVVRRDHIQGQALLLTCLWRDCRAH